MAVSGFTILNPPAEATGYNQSCSGSTAFSVGIDTFTNNATGAGATVLAVVMSRCHTNCWQD